MKMKAKFGNGSIRNKIIYFPINPIKHFLVSGSASDEIYQNNDGLERRKGIGKLLLKRRHVCKPGAKVLRPVVLVDLQGNRLCGKEALDRKSTRLNSSHDELSRMPSSA